jgi:hypothetical protein
MMHFVRMDFEGLFHGCGFAAAVFLSLHLLVWWVGS